MVKLRLKRMGKKDASIYKIVAADSRSPRDGRFIESIGIYNPSTHPMTIEVKEKKALYWLKNGAQPTPTVRSLLSRKGIIFKWHLMKKGKDEAEILIAMEKWIAAQVDRAQRETAKKIKAKEKKKKSASKEEQTEAKV